MSQEVGPQLIPTVRKPAMTPTGNQPKPFLLTNGVSPLASTLRSWLSTTKVPHWVHPSAGSWALLSLAYLQTTQVPFLSSVLSRVVHAGPQQCVCLMRWHWGLLTPLTSGQVSQVCMAWTFYGLLYTSTLKVCPAGQELPLNCSPWHPAPN